MPFPRIRPKSSPHYPSEPAPIKLFHRCCIAGLLIAAGASGCQKAAQSAAADDAPVTPVSQPVSREIMDFVDFTGRTDSVRSVDIRPRVNGYLTKMTFNEGEEVKEGALLYEIDPRPYQAQFDQAQGQVNLYQAQLKLARVTYVRDRGIAGTGGAGAVSMQQLDQDKAAVEEAEARVKAYEASMEIYRINLAYTKIFAPFNGVVGRNYYSVGNLVIQDQTLMTSVVAMDPLNVYFDMDEPTLLRIRRANFSDRQIPVLLGLQGEDGYPHKGNIDFVNNRVNTTTGSITVRGSFANPKTQSGARLFAPGMFVRVRLPLGAPHKSLLVIDRAIASDQGLKFIYVVDAENKAQYRRVKLGSLQEDGLRVVTQGLKSDDWVVVGGLQQVRPKMTVQLEKRKMPSLDASEN